MHGEGINFCGRLAASPDSVFVVPRSQTPRLSCSEQDLEGSRSCVLRRPTPTKITSVKGPHWLANKSLFDEAAGKQANFVWAAIGNSVLFVVEAVIPVEWRGGGFVDGDQARVKYNSWHAPTEHANELLDPVLRAAASHVTGQTSQHMIDGYLYSAALIAPPVSPLK
ncbi:hypothetical protein Bbelb_104350 [Branchiostoma belcheri]|nr:hypothetical protein Bbelb_104350 [Branchiostoma belcheri]